MITVKISELSRQSATPIPTIKFFIREGLLPRGETTARNQADYNETHVERLDLIRRLKDYAGLSIGTITDVLGAAETMTNSDAAMGAGVDASGKSLVEAEDGNKEALETSEGYALMKAISRKRKWALADDDTTLLEAARAIDQAVEGWPFDIPPGRIENYVELVYQLAELEIQDDWDEGLTPDGKLKFGLLGTFLFEPVILALRRTATRARLFEIQKNNKAKS